MSGTNDAPQVLRDFARGVGYTLYLSTPILIALLAFHRKDLFELSYIREGALLILWLCGLLQLFPVKTFKVGKEGFEISAFDSIPPDQALPQ